MISSNEIKWDGPDIPCINICRGDTVSQIVYLLGKKLCDLADDVQFDISSIDFKCVLSQGQSIPENINQSIQAIIDYICDLEIPNIPDEIEQNPLALPDCLRYTENNVLITQLMPNDYILLLANKLCEIIDSITSINVKIDTLNKIINTLNNNTNNNQTQSPIYVVTQCVSYTNQPGEQLPIQEAFENFENSYCDTKDILGSDSKLTTAISSQCVTENDATLVDPNISMSDLGFSADLTIADTIKNMWITICDMRSKIALCCDGTPIGCVLLPVTNLKITNITTSQCTLTWDEPIVGNNENPLSYYISVYEWDGSQKVGTALFSNSIQAPASSCIITGLTDPTKVYIAEITTQYTCGDSVIVNIIGGMLLRNVSFIIDVEDVFYNPSTGTCNGEQYDLLINRTIVTLRDAITGLVVQNPTSGINVIIRYNVAGQTACSINDYTYDQIITIYPGQSSNYFEYNNNERIFCNNQCVEKIIKYSCAVSISNQLAIFNNNVSTC